VSPSSSIAAIAMMPHSYEPQVDPLDGVAVALERGDWRTAILTLFEGGDLGDRPELVDVTFCLRCVARSMRFQSVLADVEAALHQLEAALRTLGDGMLRLGAEPAPHLRIAHLRWATTRLVLREQSDLKALRLIFEGLPRGRQELIYACLEYLTLVEFDPWTVQVHPLDRELTGLDKDAYARWRVGNRKDMCVRATRLRQFADARSGSVNERTWQRMGGYPCVREQALRVLAKEPVARGRQDVPVRLGRQRAWSYARDWVKDTAA
jgi:hypothetical protein